MTEEMQTNVVDNKKHDMQMDGRQGFLKQQQ